MTDYSKIRKALPGWNSPVRDYRKEFTLPQLEALIERFICLYTREPAEEWHHSSEEMLAVLQQAQVGFAEAEKLREALQMIAANSCCAPCREAGLVACAALGLTRIEQAEKGEKDG